MPKLGVVSVHSRVGALSHVMAAVLCSVVLSGCRRAASGEAKAADVDVERMAFVGQPCPPLELGDVALKPSNVRVFVEVAEITAGALPTPVGRWLDTHAVKVRATAKKRARPESKKATAPKSAAAKARSQAKKSAAKKA